MENPPFPLDAEVGDYALGPDGRRYRLDYDDCWHVTALQRREDDRPIPHVAADDPARLAAERAHARRLNERQRARESAERQAALAAHIAAATKRDRAEEAKAALAAQDARPDPADMTVDLYEGDYADVLAEVPANVRVDGWTAARRILFLERLEEQGSIVAAARAAGMSRRAVYRLLPRAPAFAAAFARALASTTATLADTLFDRAIHGHEVPVFHGGELVGTRTVHHDRLGIYLLRVRDPLNYAPIDELERWKRERAIDAAATEPAALPSPRPEWPLTAPRDSATL
ncbi:hypothetical protein [Sphingomonas astaxanthinifaciens]|uniref:Uncharacterized protein n=1 Tax=Sphingomonas astaxanthinifaciens DSM 22298 TaxID=1123267 RepID=A0ABQ5Z975_9SPHN|nr:hypothetical protein [Sphingomonas astaxanthinifaciens]GLR48031.1 hypothetical protein GCM10007925_17440 [Sphingomonas astaxanthinifaciens DSM 22298]